MAHLSDTNLQNICSNETRRAGYYSLLKQFLLRLCVATTLGLVFLICGELISYFHFLPSPRQTLEPAVVRLQELGPGGGSARYWVELEEASRVVYQPYVLWRRAPYQGKFISIDQEGIRRTTNTQCDEKTFTIWMFGDSTMWGTGAPDDATIPSLVAADYGRTGRKVCIVNYGEKGWANTQEVIDLIENLKHTSRKPDVVLFYDGGTEAFTAYQNGRADVHTNLNGFEKYLDNWSDEQRAGFSYLRQTNTYHVLRTLATKLSHSGIAPEDFPEKRNVNSLAIAIMENYLQNIDLVELLAEHYHFRPIFAWYPNMAVGHKVLTSYEEQLHRLSEQKFPGLEVLYAAAYKRCQDVKSPDFFDLEDLLDGKKESLYLGLAHLKPEGNKIVADRLFQILLQPPSPVTAKKSGLGSVSAVTKTRLAHSRNAEALPRAHVCSTVTRLFTPITPMSSPFFAMGPFFLSSQPQSGKHNRFSDA